MPECIRVVGRVVGMVGDVPAAPVEGDLVVGDQRHLADVAPAGTRTFGLEDEVITRA